ncbi:MAG: hypothetical protein H3C43_04635, partial [Leptonema sp. (in: Bacteria)]|nr:hypothetical protein [Leptonema sp. (in: bacteria)]
MKQKLICVKSLFLIIFNDINLKKGVDILESYLTLNPMQLSILDRFAEFRKQWKQTSEIRGQFKPQWAILIISVVSLGFLIIVFGLFQKTQIELQEADRLKTQTEVVEKNLVENLKAASNALFSIRDSLPVWQRTESKAIINQRLNQTIHFIPGFRTIFILDKNGICIYSTRPELLGEDLSMREYYISAKSASNSNGTRDTKGNSKTYISAPFYSSITKVSIFTIGQIIEDQNGQFNGMIATALKPEFFSTLLSSVNYSTDMSSAVIDDNGNVLMIRPDRFQLPFDRTNIL